MDKGNLQPYGWDRVPKVGAVEKGRWRRKGECNSSIKLFSWICESVFFMDLTSTQNHHTETNPVLFLFDSIFCFNWLLFFVSSRLNSPPTRLKVRKICISSMNSKCYYCKMMASAGVDMGPLRREWTPML